MYKRKHSPHSIYHVYNRGVSKMQIFFSAKDYQRYISKLEIYKKKYKIKVIAFCIMPNHVHLLLKNSTKQSAPKRNFTRFIQSLHTAYACYFNKKYRNKGHVFESIYKKKYINTDEYLHTVINYIHENPVRKKLCKNSTDWLYSSAKPRTSPQKLYNSGNARQHNLKTRKKRINKPKN